MERDCPKFKITKHGNKANYSPQFSVPCEHFRTSIRLIYGQALDQNYNYTVKLYKDKGPVIKRKGRSNFSKMIYNSKLYFMHFGKTQKESYTMLGRITIQPHGLRPFSGVLGCSKKKQIQWISMDYGRAFLQILCISEHQI